MDKSLEDIIAEQRSKSKPRDSNNNKSSSKADRQKGPPAEDRGREKRGGARPDTRRDTRKQDAASAPPRDPTYFMHDDRGGDWANREQGGGVPRGSWKQQQRQQWDRQQQWERPRGRGRAAGGTDPIITTADGWEEVAQDDPYTDRRGGTGAQRRRGGVFDRLGKDEQQWDNGASQRSWDRRGGQQQHQQYGGGGRGGGGGRFDRGRGRGGRGRGMMDDAGGEPRRRYIDEHDHREDYPGGGGGSGGGSGRPGRYQPYRVAGGVSKPAGAGVRGPAGGRRNKWSHDLFDPNQQAPPPAAADEAAADGAAAVEEEEEAAAVEMME